MFPLPTHRPSGRVALSSHGPDILPAGDRLRVLHGWAFYSSHGSSPNSIANISQRHSAYMAASSRAAQIRRLIWAEAHS